MKKIFVVILAITMLISVGCGDNSSPLAEAVAEGGSITATAVPGEVTLYNETSYTFVELYSTPSTYQEFGDELLGGMRVEPSMTISMTIGDISLAQDFLIVDNDGDSYSLIGVSLSEGDNVYISLSNDGNTVMPVASVYTASGEFVSEVFGALISNSNANATGYDSNGNYSFTVNNNSDYTIYSIHVGIANASSRYDIDLLPQTLAGGSSMDVYGFATQGDWLNTEWTLYVTDVDGDTSASFDSFNPWTVTAVDVSWDSAVGGYVVQFIY